MGVTKIDQDIESRYCLHTSARDAKKSLDKAAKERDRGRRTRKGDGLEGGLQWVRVAFFFLKCCLYSASY